VAGDAVWILKQTQSRNPAASETAGKTAGIRPDRQTLKREWSRKLMIGFMFFEPDEIVPARRTR
jgi:hypothetical protein